MANDAASKVPPNPNENTTVSNATDQQKVPPLRIVLNSAGNQKSSSATTTSNTTTTSAGPQQTNPKKEASKDAKSDGTVKVGGRVRIKLGTNKQQSSGKSNNTSKSNDTKRTNGSGANDRLTENINEDSASSFGHLRRITRRSQRAVQSMSNEDEESISSMTSTDENQSTNNNQPTGDNLTTQELDQSNSATLTSNTAGSSAANGSSNAETPRRYKRRKVETSESQSIDCEILLGSQNYRLPNQNSFQLFKNIRNQVDKRLKNLNNVSPRIPYGFRDYMLTRGAYLLDGNKLGNGTNLFMNEDGGLNSAAPLGKYRVLRHNRTNYSVPNRAKVPLGLPVNSPLYDLFIEQEKERYRMRMQHIKEREKLTLAAEQEIMRVYHQAALAAADQTEPFSACTMLKHQEIYNYMDSNGVTILSREDAQQDQAQPDGVRTRRRQHGQISPSPPSRKTSDVDESNSAETARKGAENTTPPTENQKIETDTQQSSNSDDKSASSSKESSNQGPDTTADDGQPEASTEDAKESQAKDSSGICPITPPDNSDKSKSEEKGEGSAADSSHGGTKKESANKSSIKTEAVSPAYVPDSVDDPKSKSSDAPSQDLESTANDQGPSETSKSVSNAEMAAKPSTEIQIVTETEDTNILQVPTDVGSSLSNEDKRAQGKELFLSRLQEVDDKWEKIRHEMLVRHKNEADSLHAIQKLEWEWKTKEIGACDVRTTLIIDNTLVPKLNIYSQDY